MPWKSSDAHKHKKGLTPKQARQWAAVANSALSKCEKEGRNTGECEASAIRQANSAVGEPKAKEIMDMFNKEFYGDDYQEQHKSQSDDGEADETKMIPEPWQLEWTIAKTYADLEKEAEAREKKVEAEQLLGYFTVLAQNIMYDYEIDDKATAIENLAKELSTRLRNLDVIKEIDGDDDVKAKWTRAYINDLPDNAFLYIESGGKKNGEGKTTPRSLRHLPYKDKEGKISREHVSNAISRAPQIKLKDGSKISESKATQLQERARRILKNSSSKEISEVGAEVLRWIGDIIGVKPNIEKATRELKDRGNGMMVWKEKGEWRWLTRYSNNFRDRDTPPEIISEKSHRRFVELVDKGETPYPELWLWHVPSLKVGQATWVAYDDAGFALAAGNFDKGCEEVAEFLSKKSNEMLVSHGMPATSIKRDENDETVIVEHVTREISPLPAWAAANTLTSFITIKEANDMAINDEKKRTLIEEFGLSAATVSAIESLNESDKGKAISDGIESKEVATDTEVVLEKPTEEAVETATDENTSEEQVAEVDNPKETKQKTEEVDELDKPPSRKEVVDAVTNVFKPVLDEQNQQISELKESVSSLVEIIGKLQASDEQKIKKIADDTPKASLQSLLSKSIIGDNEAEVGDNDPLKDKKPKEKDPESELPNVGAFQVPFIKRMVGNEIANKK